jgi:hypothetical protein
MTEEAAMIECTSGEILEADAETLRESGGLQVTA